MRCPIWGHVFGSKKSKKSDTQSRFWPKLDFQKSLFCDLQTTLVTHWSDMDLSWKWRLLWEGVWDIKKNFTPVRCPIWGHVFGSEKSKKSDHQSHFPSKHDFQKSSFCSTNPYTFIYTLLSADNRTTRHHLCDLLLKIDDFWKKVRVENHFPVEIFEIFHFQKHAPLL